MVLRVPKIPMKCMPMRAYTSAVCCFGVIMSFILRFCISLAILKMVKIQKHRKFSSDCFNATEPNNTAQKIEGPSVPEFDWSEGEQGYILSSIFFTYFVFQIPAGFFTDMIGAVPISAGGMVVTSLMSLITPEVARLGGYVGLVVLRLVMGAGQALSFIPVHAIINAWIPKKERSTWGAFIFAGSHLGSCANMFITGALLGVLEWPWVFRLYGVLGLVWVAIFLFTCYSYPDQCKYLSEKEKKLLEESGLMERKKHHHPPWLKILVNAPLWAATAATFGHGWVLFSLMSDLPKFLKSVFHISLRTNSFINGVMYILIFANAVGSGPVVDLINRRKLVSLSWNRKIFVTVASLPPALGLLWSVYAHCNLVLAVVPILIGCALLGYFYSSGKLCGIDMSPHYSGTVSSIINALGTTAGFIATNVVGQLTPNESVDEWRVVMWICLAIMGVSNVVFVIWGSSEVQPFDNPEAAQEAVQKKLKKEQEKRDKGVKKLNKNPETPEKERNVHDEGKGPQATLSAE